MSNNSVKKKKIRLGSYPGISVITGISLALFLLGAFGVIVIHATKFSEQMRENVEMQIYLLKSSTENQRNKIKQELLSMPYIAERNGEMAIKYISKTEAAENFIEDTGEDFFSILENNPLHDAFIINLKQEYIDEIQMKRIKREIESVNGVFEVNYVENLVKDINRNIQSAGIIILILFGVFLFASIILINNTIKLALFSQRFLIRSMQLVGAKASFIQKPFLIRASLHGLLSGLIASAMIGAFLLYAYDQIEDLKILYDQEKLLVIFASLLILGLIIGLGSSYRAIHKYLRLSLDELY